jgi:hypothetical protein
VAAPASTAYYGPRFDYDPVTLAPKGLLIEEQRTQLLLRSEEFDAASWTKLRTTATANTTTAPDGTTTAETLAEEAVSESHAFIQSVAFTNGLVYTFSIYAKKGTGSTAPDWVQLSFGTTGFPVLHANFDIQNGVVGTTSGCTATISADAQGFYRISITATANLTTTSGLVVFAFTNNNNSLGRTPSYVGSTTSNVILYGAQLEQGAFSTSYIPSVASQVTRAADSASMIGNNFARWYNVNSGTFYAQSDSFGTGTRRITFASDGTDSNRIVQSFTASTNLGFVITSGNLQAQMSVSGTGAANTALAYATDNFAFARNATLDTDSAGTVPVGLTQMQIGAGLTAATSPLNGTISRIAYFNRRLADSELIGITS